jgi:hypothetical protein
MVMNKEVMDRDMYLKIRGLLEEDLSKLKVMYEKEIEKSDEDMKIYYEDCLKAANKLVYDFKINYSESLSEILNTLK